MPTIALLRKTFYKYEDGVLNYHSAERCTEAATFVKKDAADDDRPVPTGTLSCASRGNFLEVLNMSLNTFENHYLSRNPDRTGQQSIVITPGVGIFHVCDQTFLQQTFL